MRAEGLMARVAHGSYHHPWASRDYEDIDCRATGCLFNHYHKCSVPSICKIGDDGKCAGFKPVPAPRGLQE